MIDTAVIMAAGKGTRFGARTSDMPKGFIEFKGRSMIERSIDNLLAAGIKRIIIGTGYHREWYENLICKYPQIITVFSPVYEESNSMETLYRCREAIGDSDFLLLESDIIYEPKALTLLLEDSHDDILLASDITKFQDQYYIAVDENRYLEGCSTDKDYIMEEFGAEPYGELVGIHKLSNRFYQAMVEDYEYHRHDYLKRGYEYEIEDVATAQVHAANIISLDASCPISTRRVIGSIPMFVLKPHKLSWYEIDDEPDLKYAEGNIKIL